MKSDVLEKLTQFVVDELLHGDGADLDATTPLLELAILDSMGVHQLIAFVERAFQIEVPSSDLTPQNLRDLRSIAAMVERLGG